MKCLSCNRAPMKAECILGPPSLSRLGSPAICFHCGFLMVIDNTKFGVREPTAEETVLLEADPMIARCVQAWLRVRAP